MSCRGLIMSRLALTMPNSSVNRSLRFTSFVVLYLVSVARFSFCLISLRSGEADLAYMSFSGVERFIVYIYISPKKESNIYNDTQIIYEKII